MTTNAKIDLILLMDDLHKGPYKMKESDNQNAASDQQYVLLHRI